MEEKIKVIAKEVLGSNFEVIRVVDFQGFLYVFYEDSTYSNPYNDERLRIIGGTGPLKINKTTLECEITDLIDFYFEHGDNELFFPETEEVTKTFEKIIEDILMRKRINWDDFYEVLRHTNLELNQFDIYSEGILDEVYIQVKSELACNMLIDFLEKLNAKYKIDTIDKYKFFINLNL